MVPDDSPVAEITAKGDEVAIATGVAATKPEVCTPPAEQAPETEDAAPGEAEPDDSPAAETAAKGNEGAIATNAAATAPEVCTPPAEQAPETVAEDAVAGDAPQSASPLASSR